MKNKRREVYNFCNSSRRVITRTKEHALNVPLNFKQPPRVSLPLAPLRKQSEQKSAESPQEEGGPRIKSVCDPRASIKRRTNNIQSRREYFGGGRAAPESAKLPAPPIFIFFSLSSGVDVWRELHSLVNASRNSRRYRHRRGI